MERYVNYCLDREVDNLVYFAELKGVKDPLRWSEKYLKRVGLSDKATEKLEKLFPNSTVRAISQFPSPHQNMDVLQDSLDYDDVVFLTFAEAPAYAGSDHITRRILALMDALAYSGKLTTIAHFGNPYPLQEVPHVPRLIVGFSGGECEKYALEILCGKREAKGRNTPAKD